MNVARRPRFRLAPKSRRGTFRASALLFVLAAATLASSCLLNPQPEPPSTDESAPGAGSGGVGGAGGGPGAGAAGGSFGGTGINIDGGAGAGAAAGSSGAAGSGGSGGGDPGSCRTAMDCAADRVCFASSGSCAPVPTADCVPPLDEAGQSARLAACSAASPCSAGLTCVPLTQVLGAAGAYEPGASGVCLTACDPCMPTQCGAGETCFARTPGRGFCAPPLVPEGMPCGSAVTPAPCAAGLTCAELFEQAGRTCLRHCRPEPNPDVSTHADHSASPSADCRPGEVCFETASSSALAAASEFACVSGTLVDGSGACGGDRFCRAPARCVAGACGP